jgi:hypothetical protein
MKNHIINFKNRNSLRDIREFIKNKAYKQKFNIINYTGIEDKLILKGYKKQKISGFNYRNKKKPSKNYTYYLIFHIIIYLLFIYYYLFYHIIIIFFIKYYII